jgi:hypothetical protein
VVAPIVEWSAEGGKIDCTGRYVAEGAGTYIVRAIVESIETSAVVHVVTELPPPPPPPLKGVRWQGNVPPQKWMNFYTKVLSRFAGCKEVNTTDSTTDGDGRVGGAVADLAYRGTSTLEMTEGHESESAVANFATALSDERPLEASGGDAPEQAALFDEMLDVTPNQQSSRGTGTLRPRGRRSTSAVIVRCPSRQRVGAAQSAARPRMRRQTCLTRRCTAGTTDEGREDHVRERVRGRACTACGPSCRQRQWGRAALEALLADVTHSYALQEQMEPEALALACRVIARERAGRKGVWAYRALPA